MHQNRKNELQAVSLSNLAWDKLKFKTHGKYKFMVKRNAIATKLTKRCTQTQKRAFDVAVQSMPEYARVCKSMQEYARVYQSMPEYSRVCQSMPEYARVCQSMPEYARVC